MTNPFRKHLYVRLGLLWFALGFVTRAALAAQAETPTTGIDLGPLLDAVAGQKWSLALALVLGLTIAAAKQGWLSRWLASKLPPASLPYLAVALGSLAMVSAQVVAGKPWLPSLGSGALAGLLAIFGHETVVEGARGGKELVPERKPAAPPPAAAAAS